MSGKHLPIHPYFKDPIPENDISIAELTATYLEYEVLGVGETLVDDDGNALPFKSKLRPDLKASLEMLVSGTQQLLTRNTNLKQWMLNEESDLNRLLEWIRRE